MKRTAKVNPTRFEMRNGLCKLRFTSARASMQSSCFKPGLSHPQPGLNEVIAGTQGPPWSGPGLNFLSEFLPSRPHSLASEPTNYS
jgi:hypothetical protein